MTIPSEILLPVPPSANALFVRTNRTVKSLGYKDWQWDAHLRIVKTKGMLLKITKPQPYQVQITANVSRRRDLDNLAKPTVDLLAMKGITPDDRWLDVLELRRVDSGVGKNKMLVKWKTIDSVVESFSF